jgi:hypothetical protein
LPHAGAEERPTGPYFATARPQEHSQGNLYVNVPYVLQETVGARLRIVARDVMLVTRSCDLDFGAQLVHIASLADVATRVTPQQVTDLRRYDCFHDVMYLPNEDGLDERIVNLGATQSIPLSTLVLCERQARLTYVATQQLQRKLALHWTGVHFPRDEFRPPADDF